MKKAGLSLKTKNFESRNLLCFMREADVKPMLLLIETPGRSDFLKILLNNPFIFCFLVVRMFFFLANECNYGTSKLNESAQSKNISADLRSKF